jgi:transposase-like protein
MSKELTEKQKKEYVNGGYNNCPYCKSDNIHSYVFGKDDNWVECRVTCEQCETTWKDIYTLTDIQEF